jgi:hypothetical protein
MRRITISLLAASFAIQGCGSPAGNPASSDPGSNITSTATNDPEPANAQSNAAGEGTSETGGGSAENSPFLKGTPTVTGTAPTVSNPPPPANAAPQPR